VARDSLCQHLVKEPIPNEKVSEENRLQEIAVWSRGVVLLFDGGQYALLARLARGRLCDQRVLQIIRRRFLSQLSTPRLEIKRGTRRNNEREVNPVVNY